MIKVISDAFDNNNTGGDMVEIGIILVFFYFYRELFKWSDDTRD